MRILTVNWKAFTKRTVSSTERPTGKSLTVICLSADPGEKICPDAYTEDEPQNTLGVDDEETTEGDTLFLDQDTVIFGDFHVSIRKKGQPEIGAKTTLLTRLVCPRKVRVLRVGGDGKDLGVELLELGEGIIEGEDFRWTNEGEVPGEHK